MILPADWSVLQDWMRPEDNICFKRTMPEDLKQWKVEIGWVYDTTPSYVLDPDASFENAVIFALENYYIVLCIGAAYLAAIVVLKKAMASREAFDLRGVWMCWNFFLSLFSALGSFHMLWTLVTILKVRGFERAVCGHSHYFGFSGSPGFWTFCFIFSKIPELLDTMFIILSKRPLILLQWYHHITVLFYTWHAYATLNGAGIWFITMNYTVHAVMYFYFGMMQWASMSRAAAKRRPAAEREQAVTAAARLSKRLGKFAPLITLMQIAQMVVGIAILVLTYHYTSQGTLCCVHSSSWLAGLVMYASYFVLFMMFAVQRYFCRTPKEGKVKTK